MDEPFDQIELLVPFGMSKQIQENYTQSLRSMPFRKRIDVRRSAYVFDSAAQVTECDPGVHPNLSSAELTSASDLMVGHWRSQMVLKFPNEFVSKSGEELAALFKLWSRAVRRAVPADFDIVYCAPERVPQKDEFVPCSAYIMSKAGAQKVMLQQRYGTPPSPPMVIYALDLGP